MVCVLHVCLCVSMMYAVFVYFDFDSVFVSQEKKRKKNERWVRRVMWRRKKAKIGI